MKTESIVRFRNMRVTGDLDKRVQTRISYGDWRQCDTLQIVVNST